MPILVTGLSHRSSPVEVRERFAFADSEIAGVLEEMRHSELAEEVVVLSTCNRVEVYAYSASPAPPTLEALERFLAANRGYEAPLGTEIYALSEPQSVEHLFKVASGLDSMVLGETEILGQIKKAYQLALESGHTGGRLNKAFQKAFNVAKHIRTHTNIQRGSISVSSVGVELAEKIFSSLSDRRVMVIGAGDTSEKAARALLSRGAHSIIVSNRSFERAEALAKELDGRAIHFEQWDREFNEIDIVISSTSAPHYVLDRQKLEPLLKARQHRPLLLIDLAVPRDIEPEVNFLDEVYLYNVDDLQAIANDYLEQRQSEIAQCESIIRERAASVLTERRKGPEGGGDLAFGHE